MSTALAERHRPPRPILLALRCCTACMNTETKPGLTLTLLVKLLFVVPRIYLQQTHVNLTVRMLKARFRELFLNHRTYINKIILVWRNTASATQTAYWTRPKVPVRNVKHNSFG